MSELHAEAYRGLRGRVREVVEAADADAMVAVVPATPEWRAHDVLAHLVGVTDDVVSGRLEGIATDSWTQAQVDARVTRSTGELLAEWSETGRAVRSAARGCTRGDRGPGAVRRGDARA